MDWDVLHVCVFFNKFSCCLQVDLSHRLLVDDDLAILLLYHYFVFCYELYLPTISRLQMRGFPRRTIDFCVCYFNILACIIFNK